MKSGRAIEISRGEHCFEVRWPVDQDAKGLCDSRESALGYAEELKKYRFPEALIVDHTAPEPEPPTVASIPKRNKILEQLERAFLNGQTARRAGKGALANRYPFCSPLRTAWTAGWAGSTAWQPEEDAA